MSRIATLGLGVAAAMVIVSVATAQNSLPTYQADPDTYKVIFEDQTFRVIAATWKKGTTDKPHSHPLPFVTYLLDDCTLRIHNPDGSTRELAGKAGATNTGLMTTSHTAENVSGADCHGILVERK
jgi:hypothetical protein